MRGEARKMGAKIRSQMKDDPYIILGVDQGADVLVIKAAYRALTKKYHESGTNPDEKMMKRINLAYETIMKEKGEPK
jgi:curved DNA-binding protein CbpA